MSGTKYPSSEYPDLPFPGRPQGFGSSEPTHPYGAFNGHDTLTSSLVSYWKLDEASGTRYDSFGSNHLTDNNTVTSGWGKRGMAASFVAADSESLSNGPGTTFLLNGTSGSTIAGWFYHDGQVNEVIASMDNGVAERRWLLYTENANKLKFYGWNASNGAHSTADAAFTTNTWNFVCAWYNPADGKGTSEYKQRGDDSIIGIAGRARRRS